jgi:Skp family chaperone for outer membrane proteins
MKNRTHSFRKLLAAASLAVVATAFGAAQAAPPQPPAGGAPTARILMIDLRRVMAESKVGQSIQRQVEELKKQATQELQGEENELRSEEQQFQQQAAILAPDLKQKRAEALKAKIENFQKKARDRGSLIQGGVIKAQQQVEQALGPILEGIMRERGATILLDRSAVLLAPNAIDVSDVVEQRLDMKMPTVKVELTPLPAGAAPQGPQQ